MIRYLHAGLVSLSLALALPGVSWATVPAAPPDVGTVMDLSGLTDVIEQIPDDISAAIDDQDFFDADNLSQDDVDVIKQVLVGAFDSAALQHDVAGQFRAPANAGRLAAVLAQLRTPLSRRISALERAANSPQAESDYDDFVAGLALHAPDPGRVALVRQLDRLSHSTEITVLIQIEIAKTIAQSVAVFDPRRQPLSEADVDRLVVDLRRELNPTVRNRILVWSLYAYRSLDDRDLKAYIALYADKDMQWFLRESSSGLIKAMGKAAQRAGRGITTLRNAQQI